MYVIMTLKSIDGLLLSRGS